MPAFHRGIIEAGAAQEGSPAGSIDAGRGCFASAQRGRRPEHAQQQRLLFARACSRRTRATVMVAWYLFAAPRWLA
ncbi:hypothetical protein [Pseudoduganella sp. HUAS MS19]